MESTKRTTQSIILLTLVALIVPMVVFPRTFGMELIKPSIINLAFEVVFYGFVIFLFNRRVTLLKLAAAAGLCLVYRVAAGAAFGLLIAAMYSMDMKICLQLGIFSYPPVLFFQVVVTPFALRPVLMPLIKSHRERRTQPSETTETPTKEVDTRPKATSRERKVASRPVRPQPRPRPEPTVAPVSRETAHATPPSELNGFERATRYIGEHGSVHLAAVVDQEGLLLANTRRGSIEAEDWAPMALLLASDNQKVIDRVSGFGPPEKIDLVTKDNRVIVARESWYSLLVIAERQSDDLLNIRINQGMDIIRKYVEDRYGRKENSKTENIYVSGTK
jgi:predicted regulator of Ras-like GTPase activity (Roadblock/LC7/MglB family)